MAWLRGGDLVKGYVLSSEGREYYRYEVRMHTKDSTCLVMYNIAPEGVRTCFYDISRMSDVMEDMDSKIREAKSMDGVEIRMLTE